MLASFLSPKDTQEELIAEYTSIGKEPRCSDAAKAALDVAGDVLTIPISSVNYFASDKAISQGSHLPLLDFTCGISIITSSLNALKGTKELRRSFRCRDHFSLALAIHKLTQSFFVCSSAITEMAGKLMLGLSHAVRHDAFQKMAFKTLHIANYITIPIGGIRLVGNLAKLYALKKMRDKMRKVEDMRSPMAILNRLRRKAVQKGFDTQSENQILKKASQLERAFGSNLTRKILDCKDKALASELIQKMKNRLRGEMVDEAIVSSCNVANMALLAVIAAAALSGPALIGLISVLFAINLLLLALDFKSFIEELEENQVGKWDNYVFAAMIICSILSIIFSSLAAPTPAALIFSLGVGSAALIANFIAMIVLYRNRAS